MSLTGGKIVKHLIATKGPMSTQQLMAFVPTYQTQFISKTHLKKKILASLEGEGVIMKQVTPQELSVKRSWNWHIADEASIEKYKSLDIISAKN